MADLENKDNQSSDEPSSAEKTSEKLVHSFNEFEKGFRKNYPLFWWASLLAPVVVTIAVLIVIGIFSEEGWTTSGKFVSHAIATFFLFGRFVILTGTEDAETITMLPSQLFWLVTYMDFMVALFVTFHMGLLFRIPWVGPKIAMLVWDGKFVMDSQPWLKKVSIIGLVLFVIFPTSTTGSIGGSIFGRLLGLSRAATISGVLAGSLLGNGLMLGFANFINEYVKGQMWLKIAGIVLILVAVFFLERRYRAAKNRYLEGEGVNSSDDAETQS